MKPMHPAHSLSATTTTAPASSGGVAAWALPVAAVGVLLIVAVGTRQPWIVLLVFAPVVEELLFRAGLQELLLRRGVRSFAANAFATLAFALVHGLLRSWPLALAVLLPSLLLGRVYQARRRLAPVVALHAAMNLLWVALGARLHDLWPFVL